VYTRRPVAYSAALVITFLSVEAKRAKTAQKGGKYYKLVIKIKVIKIAVST
jgi:hypothetical protein